MKLAHRSVLKQKFNKPNYWIFASQGVKGPFIIMYYVVLDKVSIKNIVVIFFHETHLEVSV